MEGKDLELGSKYVTDLWTLERGAKKYTGREPRAHVQMTIPKL